jgi:hypothetical protein
MHPQVVYQQVPPSSQVNGVSSHPYILPNSPRPAQQPTPQQSFQPYHSQPL